MVWEREMKPHPAADIFPMIDGEAFDAMVSDMRAHGLIHPIVMLDGKVLDGRNRLRACYAANVTPKFVQYTGKDPLGYVVSANLARRHLDASQRAMVAARVREASANLRSSIGKKSEVVGSAMNVSARSVDNAAKVLEHGAAATIKAVEAGELAVSRAAKIADLPKMEQRAAVKEALDPEAHGYSEDDQRKEYAADFEAMARIIESDDKLFAAVGELRVVRKTLGAVEAILAGKDASLQQMTKEAARWMKKAKKAAACQDCMTALERP